MGLRVRAGVGLGELRHIWARVGKGGWVCNERYVMKSVVIISLIM